MTSGQAAALSAAILDAAASHTSDDSIPVFDPYQDSSELFNFGLVCERRQFKYNERLCVLGIWHVFGSDTTVVYPDLDCDGNEVDLETSCEALQASLDDFQHAVERCDFSSPSFKRALANLLDHHIALTESLVEPRIGENPTQWIAEQSLFELALKGGTA